MKIKNIVQIVTLTGLVATGSSHAMLANGAKARFSTLKNASSACNKEIQKIVNTAISIAKKKEDLKIFLLLFLKINSARHSSCIPL